MESVDLNRHAKWLAKADILTDALPFMRRYNGQSVVIKYGGHAMGDAELAAEFAADMVLSNKSACIQWWSMAAVRRSARRWSVWRSKAIVDGLRSPIKRPSRLSKWCWPGRSTRRWSRPSTGPGLGRRAVGQGRRINPARRLTRTSVDPDSQIEKVLDLGFAGEPAHVDVAILKTLAENRVIPVVAPIGLGAAGETFNINADTAAGAVAVADGAKRLLMLTDVAGVLDGDGNLISELSVGEARALIADGTIKGGMIPKIETCVAAVEGGVEAA